MKKFAKKNQAIIILAVMIFAFCTYTALASADTSASSATEVLSEKVNDSSTGNKALAAAVCVGLAAAAASIGMGLAIGKSAEGISRQPEAANNIRTSLMLGLVFIETAIIYALIIAILIIFVL